MTPDTPLLFFWTACLWALARLLRSGRPAWWLAIGLFAGLALASKYTALLLWVGIGLWLLWVPSQRHWWRSPMLWAGDAARRAGASCPWCCGTQSTAGPASCAREAASRPGSRRARRSSSASWSAARSAWRRRWCSYCSWPASAGQRAAPGGTATRRGTLLAALTLPGAAVFVQHALGDRVQGNWPAILYPAAAVAAAGLGGPALAAPALARRGAGAGDHLARLCPGEPVSR